MTIRPLYNKVVLRKAEKEVTTKSGLILSATAAEVTDSYEVLAVGPGTKDEAMELKVGDKVVYNPYSITEVKYGGQEYMILKQSDIFAIVE